MVKQETFVTEGDYVFIKSKGDVEKRLPYLLKRLNDWDYFTPLAIKFERYSDPRTISQNKLFHKWCDQMSKHFIKRIETATKENIKMMMKQRFLGTYDIVIGKTVIEGQVKASSKLTKGEMVHFMDNVYHWAKDNGVLLIVPEDSEYQRMKQKQDR